MKEKENTFYFANLKGRGIKEVKGTMEIWADRLGLQNYLHLPVGKLSRGMQQKAAIICSMAFKPDILILDEPLLGLDVMTRFEMEKIIDDIKKDTTLILSSHDLKFIEKVTDRVAIFKEGKIISIGSISDLKPDLSVYKYNITLKKPYNSSNYEKELEKINGLEIKEIYSDHVKDLVELTLTKEELMYDVMEVLKECQLIPIEINSLDNDFQEIFLRILDRKDKDYETCNEC